MKRYRFRIDTPWGKKWEFLNEDELVKDLQRTLCGRAFSASSFPDLFEPVEEFHPWTRVGVPAKEEPKQEKCEHEWKNSLVKIAGIVQELCIKCDATREKPQPRLLAPALVKIKGNEQFNLSNFLYPSKEEAMKWTGPDFVSWPARIDPETGCYVLP